MEKKGGAGMITLVSIIIVILIGGILYYLSLPKQIGKEMNYPNLISCEDSDGDNIKFKSTSVYTHSDSETGEGENRGSITDYCDYENSVNGKPAIKEAICDGQNSYFLIKTCGWFSKCVDGKCE